MRPLIRNGDLLEVGPCTASELRLGDVILVAADGDRVLVHRLVARRRGADGEVILVTRGDAASRPDAPVQAGQVLGRVSGVCGPDGRVRSLDRGMAGWLGRLMVRLPGGMWRMRLLWRRARVARRWLSLCWREDFNIGAG